MKVYTKRGDKGQTDLIGGERVAKNSANVEAYGTVDELMAAVGVAMTCVEAAGHREQLQWIQNRLMACASILAIGKDIKGVAGKVPPITQAHIHQLEEWIDAYESQLPPLRAFVLPGGHCMAVAQSHVARTICRRAERRILSVEGVPDEVLGFINRLSDYFFNYGRMLAQENSDDQTPWVPN